MALLAADRHGEHRVPDLALVRERVVGPIQIQPQSAAGAGTTVPEI